MAPPIRKKKKFSSDNHQRLISFTAIGEHEQQSMGSLVTLFGERRSLRVAKKTNRPLWTKTKRWVCNDVWMDTFPFFDRPQLGLKLALISPRFDVLVDTHFDGKRELKLWRYIRIDQIGKVPKLSVSSNYVKFVPFPLPEHPLPSKIHFKDLQITYIDHAVIAFLRANKQIFDGRDTKLALFVNSRKTTTSVDVQPIWDVLAHEIWPIFATNIRHLQLSNAAHLDNLRRRISPTILSDLLNLNSIASFWLLPDASGDDDNDDDLLDGSNAATFSAGQALSKWLHTPSKDGQTKRFRCIFAHPPISINEWIKLINSFKKKFLRATTTTSSACYTIQFTVHLKPTSMVPFELVNQQSNEKLTLYKASETVWASQWVMKRCQIGETTTVQWEDENLDNLNGVRINLCVNKKCIGLLSPQPAAEEEDEESGQSDGKGRRTVRK